MSKIAAHVNNIALHHMVFALPFAYMSAFLAAEGRADFYTLFFITLAIMGARSAALALDNLADVDYDRLQKRHRNRALVSGRLTKREVKLSILLYLGIFFFAVLNLNPICLKLLPLATIPFLVYPYTKRFTCLCHLVLGIAIAMAPAGSWVAVRGTIDAPVVVLSAAVALWIGGFDAVYGAQDEAFDLKHNLHSLATQFTAKGALKIVRVAHFISIILFVLLGLMLHLGPLYYVGVFIAACTLFYQHSIVSHNDFSHVTQAYFMRNGIVSVAMFVFTWLSLS